MTQQTEQSTSRRRGSKSMPQITMVHLLPGAGSPSHQHIGSVCLADGRTPQRSFVIRDIKSGTAYWTMGGGTRGKVYVHACPYCGAEDYITTHPDQTTANDLLDLP